MQDIRRVVRFLLRTSRQMPHTRSSLALILLFSVAAGVTNTALLALINQRLHAGGGMELLTAFLVLCALMPLASFASRALLLHLVQRSMFSLRLELCRRILRAPLRHLERLGAPRLLAALTDDVTAIATALAGVPVLAMHLTVLVGCTGYLIWLSWRGGLVVILFLTVGVASYQWPMAVSRRHLSRFRQGLNRLFAGLQALTHGTKELKLHAARRRAFVDDALVEPLDLMKTAGFSGNVYLYGANSWGQVLFFLAIGLVIFGLPAFGSAETVVASYPLILLFMLTPLQGFLEVLPLYNRARVAVEELEGLGPALAHDVDPEPEVSADATLPGSFERLELRGVCHTYHREGSDDRFTLGPIDLEVTPGEVVFVVGGNGSGKTTLAKLLIGLYAPEAGEIRVDGKVIDDARRDAFRQLFSAVFTDFHLFESLYGLPSSRLDETALGYLRKLHLDHKVKVEDGMLSSVELSQGQRKRLALLTAYLEDRPIYLFDEWAADQDPTFKEIFYRELLPELARRGKTALVISHDDRYYDAADRVLKLEEGQIVEG